MAVEIIRYGSGNHSLWQWKVVMNDLASGKTTYDAYLDASPQSMSSIDRVVLVLAAV